MIIEKNCRNYALKGKHALQCMHKNWELKWLLESSSIVHTLQNVGFYRLGYFLHGSSTWQLGNLNLEYIFTTSDSNLATLVNICDFFYAAPKDWLFPVNYCPNFFSLINNITPTVPLACPLRNQRLNFSVETPSWPTMWKIIQMRAVINFETNVMLIWCKIEKVNQSYTFHRGIRN